MSRAKINQITFVRFMIRAMLVQNWLPNALAAIRSWPSVHLMYSEESLIRHQEDPLSKLATILTTKFTFQLDLINR